MVLDRELGHRAAPGAAVPVRPGSDATASIGRRIRGAPRAANRTAKPHRRVKSGPRARPRWTGPDPRPGAQSPGTSAAAHAAWQSAQIRVWRLSGCFAV